MYMYIIVDEWIHQVNEQFILSLEFNLKSDLSLFLSYKRHIIVTIYVCVCVCLFVYAT